MGRLSNNRLWAAILVTAVVLSLTACGGGKVDAPTPPAEPSAEVTAKPTPAAAPTVQPTAMPTAEPTPEAAAEPSTFPYAPREYTLTEVSLPEGWEYSGDTSTVAAGWASIHRREAGQIVAHAIYRAADGAILDLDGYVVFGSPGPTSLGTDTRCLVAGAGPQQEGLWNVYDVEAGRLLLDTPVADGDEGFGEKLDPLLSHVTWPQPKEDEATWLWGYVDEAGSWVIPAQYSQASPFQDGVAVVSLLSHEVGTTAIDPTGREILPRRYSMLFYLGDGCFTYWGGDGTTLTAETECGLVTTEGVETPTRAFSNWFNGGLTANYGVIAMSFDHGGSYDDAYFDYAGNRVSEFFDWAGPVGDDGAGFVGKDGVLYRIQF